MSEIKILHLGVEEYSTVFEKMKKLQERRIEDEIMDTLIFVTHPEVVTLGPKAVRDGVERLKIIRYSRQTEEGGNMAWTWATSCLSNN